MFKSKLTPIFTAICLMGSLPSNQAFAATSATDDARTEQLIKKINMRTAQLESEVKKLRAQLVDLKKAERADAIKQSSETKRLAGEVKQATTSKTSFLELGATPVISSPYIGVRSQYDASDLIVNIPSYNQDLRLLQQQDKLLSAFNKQGLTAPSTPLIELSGKIEGQVVGARDNEGRRESDVDLSGTEFDVTGHFTPWLTGFIALSYDNNASNAGSMVGPSVSRMDNSRIYLNKAWITVGNLSRSPFYATIGQRYHFGQYASFMVSSPLTQLMARIKARSLLIGYQHPGANGIYSSLFIFKGDANTDKSHINQIGATLGYQYVSKAFNTDIGVDFVNNIADAQGMQNTGYRYNNGSSMGFAYDNNFERLVKRVPGAAVHGKLGVGPFSLIAEYTGAMEDFDSANLNFNGRGAKPQAYDIEGAYSFRVMNKPANVALGYAQTKDALALLLPQRRLITAFNISIWKDTIASLEFKRDQAYNITDTARIQNVRASSRGGYSNSLTAQFGVYF